MDVVVAGGGVASVETAMTLALGLPSARIRLVHDSAHAVVLPNLVYLPFHIDSHPVQIPIADALQPYGIECIEGHVDAVDAGQRLARVDGADVSYDALVLATGTTPERVEGRTLRSIDDALTLRGDLDEIRAARCGCITVLQLPENTWPAPGYELAALLGTWRAAHKLDGVEIALVTSVSTPLGLFGLGAFDLIVQRLRELDVDLITGVPAGRVEGLAPRGLAIDMVALRPRHIPGTPAVGPDGFYVTRSNGMIADGIFAVGDAANVRFKAAFTTPWQARRTLETLGGDLSVFGEGIGGLPVDHCEYQMDLGNGTLAVDLPCRTATRWGPVVAGKQSRTYAGPPDKLRGTLIRQHLLTPETNPAHEVTFEQQLRVPDMIEPDHVVRPHPSR